MERIEGKRTALNCEPADGLVELKWGGWRLLNVRSSKGKKERYEPLRRPFGGGVPTTGLPPANP